MSRLYHCLSGVCDGASLRSRLMPLADFLTLEYLRYLQMHIKHTIFLRWLQAIFFGVGLSKNGW
mgnify:CR=1 FL=1